MIRPKTLIHHELIGLDVSVIKSRMNSIIGLNGTIVGESKNMFVISSNNGIKKIPKNICEFRITLPDGIYMNVIGKNLNERPENRLKKASKGIWKIW